MRLKRLVLPLLRLMQRRWLFAALTILIAVMSGAIGFSLIEGLPFLDGIYVATQTVTSVGYGDLPPKTTGGRIFATVFMLAGGGLVLYALSFLFQSIIESGIVAAMGSRRRSQAMNKLENHYIVCGAGRVGARIIRELKRQNCPFVILERDEKKVAPFAEQGDFVIIGDATLEENLRRARVHRAKGLAACLPDAAANVYVVLTARDLNKEMHIVARG